MPPESSASAKLDSIQMLRAVAASLVVFGHTMGAVATLCAEHDLKFARMAFPTGSGVDLFFIISGFIMVIASGRIFGSVAARAIFCSAGWCASCRYIGR